MRYCPLYSIIFLLSYLTLTACNQKPNHEIIFENAVLSNTSMWVIEQDTDGKVLFTQEGIEILDSSGCTVWFKPELEQPLIIEYKVKVIDKGGLYDRLSDMNVFWLASDPFHPNNIFWEGNNRNGQFRQYDNLQLYYVGLGGHDNTNTRYRRYDGHGYRPLEDQYDLTEKEFLLEPNKTYTVRIEANGDRIIYSRDDKIIFEIFDDKPLQSGWFGFRTWRSHQLISDFKVYKIVE